MSSFQEKRRTNRQNRRREWTTTCPAVRLNDISVMSHAGGGDLEVVENEAWYRAVGRSEMVERMQLVGQSGVRSSSVKTVC